MANVIRSEVWVYFVFEEKLQVLNCSAPLIERLEPRRINALSDNDEPMLLIPTTESVEGTVLPFTERVDPNRTNERKDSEEPTCAKL